MHLKSTFQNPIIQYPVTDHIPPMNMYPDNSDEKYNKSLTQER
jgi:hypothetical protein